MSTARQIALEFTRDRFPGAFSVTEDAVFEEPDGTSTVYLQQTHRDVPVHLSRVVVRVDDGAPSAVSGRPIEVPPELSVTPHRDAVNAADLALREAMASEPSRRIPKIEAQFRTPARPSVLRRTDFRAPIRASLTVGEFEGGPRLAWHLRWETDEHEAWEALVTADERETVIRSWRADSGVRATARVHRIDPDHGLETVEMPLGRDEHPWFGHWRVEEPRDWVKGDATSGLCAVTYEGALRRVAKGRTAGGTLAFEPDDPLGVDQRRLNAFFTCSWLHDFFYTLGFDEARGNFQSDNFVRPDKAGDEMRIVISRGFGPWAAGLVPARDGIQPHMFLYPDPESENHTALDAHVVIHEYTHAVSDRLIAGPDVSAVYGASHESQAVNEGFSDYFAMSLVNRLCEERNLPKRTVFGRYASGRPSGYRPQPYDGSLSLRYADVTSGDHSDPHHTGQVWCQILLDIEADLVASTPHPHPFSDMWALVFNTMRDLAPQPTLPDCRSVLLRAAARPGWSRAALHEQPETITAIERRFDHFDVPPGGGP